MSLPSRCLAVNICSEFAIPPFERHVTVLSQHLLDGQRKTMKKIRQELRFPGRDSHRAHAFYVRTIPTRSEVKPIFENNFLKLMSS
jgi:hypothetical protein